MSVQLFAKITGSALRVLIFHRRTILDLKLQRKLVYSSVYFAVIYTSVNVLTRTVSPLRIIYGVLSNPCVSIYIIHDLKRRVYLAGHRLEFPRINSRMLHDNTAPILDQVHYSTTKFAAKQLECCFFIYFLFCGSIMQIDLQ